MNALLLLGVLAGKTGRDSEAIAHFNRVLELDSRSFETLFWLSMLHRRNGWLREALEYAKQAVHIRPNDGYGANNLGLCYLDSMALDSAAEAFQGAAKMRPDMPQIYHNLGTALYMLGRDLDARKRLTKRSR